jgi:methylmalonyl-CoA mutase N-terminal domain/subunit
VESLTDTMENDALDYLRRIEEMGGVVAAIEEGFQQREIAEASYKYQGQVDSASKTIVGLNKYRSEDDTKPSLLRIDHKVEQAQLERLERLKDERDAPRVEAALRALALAADGQDNLIPLMLEAVRAYATIGEVCQALVPAFGTYREVAVI